MDPFQNLFLRKLAERINSVISTKTGQLIDPKSRAKDHADYVGRAEYIQALNDVTQWMEEIQRDLNRPDTDPRISRPGQPRRNPIYES